MLTTEQIAFFQEHGYLILENFIDAEIIDGWREQIWEHFDSSLETPANMAQRLCGAELQFLAAVWAVACDARNYRAARRRAILPVVAVHHLSNGPIQRKSGRCPVADTLMPTVPVVGVRLCSVRQTYLYDVKPGGGAFVFWPQSHQSTHKYFLEYPEQIDGSFYDIEDWGWHVLSDLSPDGPREFIGAAGDVVLWHAFLCHTGSANVRDIPRFGIFARYSHKKREEIKYEIPENLWKYWVI